MKKYCIIAEVLIGLLTVAIIVVCLSYKIGISPVSENNEEKYINIPANSTYLSISSILKENNLIKSELAYKFYVKIFEPNNLKEGTYILKENMGVKVLVDTLEGNTYVNELSYTIPEGKRLKEIASIISSKTNIKEQELLDYWNNSDVLDSLINKYWFLTKDIKNKDLKYPLEGYLFPDTYSILEESTKEEITYKMLDRMDEILSKYKDDINKSEFSIHEIITLASIIEYEAGLDKDRPMIAGVFINRLEIGQKLQSCVTVGYSLDIWKPSYNYDELDFDSPYNTYKYAGLPIGPINLPGEESLKAALYPSSHDYYYFIADLDDPNHATYYAKTYSEHSQNCLKYLGYSC